MYVMHNFSTKSGSCKFISAD